MEITNIDYVAILRATQESGIEMQQTLAISHPLISTLVGLTTAA
jgi:hypothetical protein